MAQYSVNRTQLLSILMTLMFFSLAFVWHPATAEEVTGQEQEISLYLYSVNGSGNLHTLETGNNGDAEEIRIESGSSFSFALNISLQSDLLVKEYKSNVGFHAYIYANSADWNTGSLKLHVHDGDSATDTNPTLLATGEVNVPAVQAGSNNEQRVDLDWIDDDITEYTFSQENYIILEVENDGDNAVDLEIDSGKGEGSDSRLITKTNPVTEMDIISESYNLETPATEDRLETNKFKPNLPSDLSKLFVSGQALNAFGTYDIVRFKVTVFDPSDSELFSDEKDIEEPEEATGTNLFEDIIWNYNDPEASSENHDGEGFYTVQVAAITQQGHEFSLDKTIQMEAYGAYISTPKTQQSVALGGSIDYELVVRNTGTQSDDFTITSSDVSNDWTVEPFEQSTGSLMAGAEKSLTFTISASDSEDMVGKNTVVVFTASSENSDSPQTFDLETRTAVGAAYEVSLFFEDESGISLTQLNEDGVAGEWNEYQLKIANQGQATDSVELRLTNKLEGDWSVIFKTDEATECKDGGSSLLVSDIPKGGDGYNIANVTVCVRPAVSTSSVDTARFDLTGYSQGNETESDTATLFVTRTFGLSLSVVPKSSQGVFINKNAGETFEIDMLLESELEGENTVSLSMDNAFPSGWSYDFKENGATVDDVVIDYQESISLVLLLTVGSQASYQVDGYTFKALATNLGENKDVIGQQQLTVILALSDGFAVSAINYREALKPGDSHTFQLTIDNNANSDDTFTVTATSVPSGWRVVFPNNNVFSVEAGRQASVAIQVTVGDDAKDGDSETITISVTSSVSNQVDNQNFVVDVEQGFTDRFVSAFAGLWYVFAFLALIMGAGFFGYYRQDDDWDYYDDDDEINEPEPTSDASGDEWDDWN